MLVRPSIKEALSEYASELQHWFANDKQRIEGLHIRKLTAWLEPQSFTPAAKSDDFDSARFELMLSNEREVWAITIDMTFYTQSFMTEEGAICEAGVKFSALSNKDMLIPISTLDVSPLRQISVTAAILSLLVLAFSKSANFNQVFAHKYFVDTVD